MSDTASDEEPTMEEILASIRRIISDDSEEDAPQEEETPVEEPAPVPEAEVEPDPEPVVEEEPDPVSEAEVEPDPEPVIEQEPAPEPIPEPVVDEVPEEEEEILDLTDFATEQPVPPADRIVSEGVEDTTAFSFDQLSSMMVSGYDGDHNTLEALVRTMLKPMLQGWLDQHLPKIVQDAVEREVARIARRK